ncbi:MAG: bleomycin resistance family protein [Cyanobacteria bacterium P01_G01_bin.54]
MTTPAGDRPEESPQNGPKKCKFDGLTPVLNVQNLARSLDYYTQVLGFQKDWDWGDPPGFACVSRDGVCIFFCEDGQGQAGTWMSIFVDDVDALYAEYQASGAIIRQAPTNFEWGMREMNIEDPDGHRLRIGSESTEPSENTVICEER